jgi:hypothetical protein
MNRRILTYLIGLGCLSILSVAVAGTTLFAFHKKPASERRSRPSDSLANIWKLADSADAFERDRLTTEVPLDFFARSNRCVGLQSGGADGPGSNGNVLSGRIVPLVTPAFRELARIRIDSTLTSIRTNRITDYRILSEQIIDQDGVVDVVYGEDFVDRKLFIFRNVDGEWKLYMVTSPPQLERQNKYFTLADCGPPQS